MSARDIAIIGAGGFGLEVAQLIGQINGVAPLWRLIGFFDDGKAPGTLVDDLPVIGDVASINRWGAPLAVALAVGTPGPRAAVVDRISNTSIDYPVLIHPTAIAEAPRHVRIGEGAIICAGTILTTRVVIGRHVVLNLHCTVGHESVIGDFCAFMPGCHISGEVTIGRASYWGTGAKIINRKTVGDCTTIGAGAVVIDDIPDHATAVGVPARVVKTGINNK